MGNERQIVEEWKAEMVKNYYLGIDGGGTKTALCLINEMKEVVDVSYCGPTSIDTVSDFTFLENIQHGLDKLHYEGQIVSVFAGIGGICTKKDISKIEDLLSGFEKLKKAKIAVNNDVYNALMGAMGVFEGIIIIAGTGSVCFGANNGQTHRCGGYCYQEGDHGSSYDLGRKALQHLAKVIDGRRKEDTFSDAIKGEINVSSFEELTQYIIKASRTQIALLAKVVTKNSNNVYAKEIIENAVEEMVEMIETVYAKLDFEKTNFSVIGSLGRADTYYKEYLYQRLAQSKCNIKIMPAKYEAYYGSSLMAFRIVHNYN